MVMNVPMARATASAITVAKVGETRMAFSVRLSGHRKLLRSSIVTVREDKEAGMGGSGHGGSEMREFA